MKKTQMNAEFPLAVHALVYLKHTERVTSSEELADNICTNPARVRKVMAKMCSAGLAEARRGKGSGYMLKDQRDISLKTVLEALGEQPVWMEWHSGDMDRECLVSSGMGAVMDGVYAGLNKVCMEQLETVTIESVSKKIFHGKENHR
ncbi:MAG: Rrf2 family transcriptional regulator [Eubacteriaceae bacterium]|nr:Rrf2 family transcriptional regulator [Eubacteriaceae bacterium]